MGVWVGGYPLERSIVLRQRNLGRAPQGPGPRSLFGLRPLGERVGLEADEISVQDATNQIHASDPCNLLLQGW